MHPYRQSPHCVPWPTTALDMPWPMGLSESTKTTHATGESRSVSTKISLPTQWLVFALQKEIVRQFGENNTKLVRERDKERDPYTHTATTDTYSPFRTRLFDENTLL